jgi:hypothetical protein
MPFNSGENSYSSTHSNQKESFDILRNSYNIAKEGFTHIPHQELLFRPSASVQQYILPVHNNSSVPYHNMDELRYINNEQRRSVNKDKDEPMVGEGIGRMIRKKSKQVNKTAKKTGKTLKKSTTDEDGLIHKGIGYSLDYGMPAIGEAIGVGLGTAAGNPALGAAVGNVAGNLARSQVKKKTGYGVKKGVGKYEKNIKLDKIIDKYVYNKGDVKKGGSQVEPSPRPKYTTMPVEIPSPQPKRISPRHDLVKKIMKEKGLSLPQASKYVKENNLYKK